MHEDVPLWDDTPCFCEPEPRWQNLQQELDDKEARKEEAKRRGGHALSSESDEPPERPNDR